MPLIDHRKSGGLSCCAAVSCTHSANWQQTHEILQVPLLGLVLDIPVVVHRQVRGRRPSDHAATSSQQVVPQSSSSTEWCLVVDRDRYFVKTVELPQVQFLDTVFADCGY